MIKILPDSITDAFLSGLRWSGYLFLLAIIIAVPAHGAAPVEIVVQGVTGEMKKNVEAALELPYGLVKEGKVDPTWLVRFASQAEARSKRALEPFGYYTATVTIRLETSAEETHRLHVDIDPGLPVILDDVRVSVTGAGASVETLPALAAAFPLQKGDRLQHFSYEQAKRAMAAHAQSLGYLDAEFSLHEIRIDESLTSGRINLILETGERYYVGDITLNGAPNYPDAVILRYIPTRPGDVFSYTQLALAQSQLSGSERFRQVRVESDKSEASNYRVPVRVTLSPAPRRTLRPGIGYGTDTGARFSLRFRDQNVLELGHEFNTNLYISERLQGLSWAYILPGSRDIRTHTSARLNVQQEDITVYESRLASLEVSRNQSLGQRRQGSVYTRFQYEAYTIGGEDATSRYLMPGLRFSDSNYDSMARPTGGFHYALDLRGTHRALGSTTEVLQLIVDAGHILSLPWRFSLRTRTKVAASFFADPIHELPPSLRFFAGGDQSVRGYAYQSLGPRNARGQVVGGKHMLAGSLELQRAIRENWAASVFYNAGNAFDSFSDIRLYEAVGIGVHYFTPVGALNLSVARQIRIEDPGFRLHFTVGFEF